MWTPNARPLVVHQLEGIKASVDSKIILPVPVAHFDLSQGDLVVEVVVCGLSRYRGKAKHGGAAAIGVRRCRNGFMISEVLTDDSL